jgi:hypothetical protein
MTLTEWLASLRAAAFAPDFAAQDLSTIDYCVSCIEHEADLVAPLRIKQLKTRRDVWHELCRHRRLQSGSKVAATPASDLKRPLLDWLTQLRLEQYHVRLEAKGLHSTLKVRVIPSLPPLQPREEAQSALAASLLLSGLRHAANCLPV